MSMISDVEMQDSIFFNMIGYRCSIYKKVVVIAYSAAISAIIPI